MRITDRFEKLKRITRTADISRDRARMTREKSEENATERYLFHCQNALYLIAEALAVDALPAVEIAQAPAPAKAKRIGNATTKKYELEVGECECGYHFGVDFTYTDQCGDFGFQCPACEKTIDTAQAFRVEASQEAPGSTNADG